MAQDSESGLKFQHSAIVGVDVGGDSSRVCVYKFESDRIYPHVNRISNRQTPTLVAFDKRLRIYGEEADGRVTSLFNTSIPLLSYIVGLDRDEFCAFLGTKKYLFGVALDECPNTTLMVTFDDRLYGVYPNEVYSFFLNKLLETVRKELDLPDEDGNKALSLALGIPIYFGTERVQKIRNYLSLLGFSDIKFFKETNCILKKWCDSNISIFGEYADKIGHDSVKVGFLDVGFIHSTFFVAEIDNTEGIRGRIASEESSCSIGTYQIIEAMADHICDAIRSIEKGMLNIPPKRSFQIYKTCAKTLKDLSTISDVKVDFERVLTDGEDFSTVITRDQLEELCKPLKELLCGMIERVMKDIDTDNFLAIEILGGGCRIPFVKRIAEEAAAKYGAHQHIRMSMDTTFAISYGATSIAKDGQPSDFDVDGCPLESEEISTLVERERQIREVENSQLEKMSTLNEIDNYIIKIKNDATDQYSQVLSLNDVKGIIDELDKFSVEAAADKHTTAKDCLERLKYCQYRVAEIAPDYIKALSDAEAKKQAELNVSVETDIPHSISKVNMDLNLPNSTCLKRASKNKEEGNVLISGGNVELAIQHYVKAIQYCAKVRDADEAESNEVNNLKLACNLNLAMCYLKIDTPASLNKAIASCTAAIDISCDNPKALFRRALAYEKLNNLDKAYEDAEHGLKRHPSNGDLKIIRERIDKKIKLQIQKQKKMYSKMF